VLAADGDIHLEALDDDGEDWYGEGPGGVAAGALEAVIAACAAPATDAEWIGAVVAAVQRTLAARAQRAGLLVKRGSGYMFHASRSVNRESIARHGLDWRRMSGPGIAGSDEPEWAGIFLSSELESARWFASMSGAGPADIWRVRVDGLWLESDPNSSSGLDDLWMIAAAPIPPEDVVLHEADVAPRGS
jgi:hypothetical protein